MNKKSSLYVISLSFTASLGGFIFGYDTAIITLTNPLLIESIMPSGMFFLYAGLTLPAIWFIWRFVPETKGKSLEEIEKYWKNLMKK